MRNVILLALALTAPAQANPYGPAGVELNAMRNVVRNAEYDMIVAERRAGIPPPTGNDRYPEEYCKIMLENVVSNPRNAHVFLDAYNRACK